MCFIFLFSVNNSYMEKDFYERVYDLIKLIPFGRVTTYREIARAAGNINASRMVGFALHNFDIFNDIPCHRVVTKAGSLSNKFVKGGRKGQKRMLEDEGIEVQKYKVDLQKYGFYFW